MENQKPTPRLLRRKQAGEYLLANYGFGAPATLSKIACVSSDGPPFRKCGRIVLYDIADLHGWVERKLSGRRRSTSDPGDDSSQNAV
jgi:hypothetical protein